MRDARCLVRGTVDILEFGAKLRVRQRVERVIAPAIFRQELQRRAFRLQLFMY